jgi:flagellar hook-associated protein 1 FlgK
MFTNSIGAESGVTTDQELSNMLEVQRIYQGSAKFLSIVDSMMESVINMV